jgi:ATP-dependent DNA helicase RecG
MLIQLIGENTFSVKEMMARMHLKNRESFMNTYLNPAMEMKLEEQLYPEQPNHPRQKYRLTDKGKELLKYE